MTSGDRVLPVDLWYPTNAQTGTASVYLGLFDDREAFADATPAKPLDAEYPVLVYSHGSQGFGATSATLMRHFASHGWLAIAPSHTGGTLLDPVPVPETHFTDRARDLTAALDALSSVTDFPARPHMSRVVVAGHSFGGRTAWTLAGATLSDGQTLRDSRVVAALVMASSDSERIADYTTAQVPVFLMSGSADQIGQEALWGKVAAEGRSWIDVAGGCHQLFALGNCADLSSDEGFAIVNTYAMAFARGVLFGDQSVTPILDGTRVVSERVRLERR